MNYLYHMSNIYKIHIHSFTHSFIIFHKSNFGYRHHWMWNLSIVYAV